MTDDCETQVRIDGWPGAFWKPVGYGEVLFTTLSSDGWLRNNEPHSTYQVLASRAFYTRTEAPDHGEQMKQREEERLRTGVGADRHPAGTPNQASAYRLVVSGGCDFRDTCAGLARCR